MSDETTKVDPPPHPLLQFFTYEHLPSGLREISAPFSDLAWKIWRELPQNAEQTTALRKLLEAKDCAVRARIAAGRGPIGT